MARKRGSEKKKQIREFLPKNIENKKLNTIERERERKKETRK